MSDRTTTTSTSQADVLQDDPPVLVDFWTQWAPRAVRMVPVSTAGTRAHGKIEVI